MSLEHFPGAREPAVLRIACQYILALHSVAGSPSTAWLGRPRSLLYVLARPFGVVS